jgi:hypothetical protein
MACEEDWTGPGKGIVTAVCDDGAQRLGFTRTGSWIDRKCCRKDLCNVGKLGRNLEIV